MEAEITAPAQWHFHDENQTSLQMGNHEIADTSPLKGVIKRIFIKPEFLSAPRGSQQKAIPWTHDCDESEPIIENAGGFKP